MPHWLKNRMIHMLFRRQINRARSYQVGHAFGWVWFGPEQEMARVFRGIDYSAERNQTGHDAPKTHSVHRTRVSLGEMDLSVSYMWNGFLENAWRDAASLYPPTAHEKLKAVTSDLARSCGRLSFSVFREGDELVLHRQVSLRKSLLPVLAARGARFWDTVQEKEQDVRLEARRCLRAMQKARLAFCRLKGHLPDSLHQLSESGLWSGSSGLVREAYSFRVVNWIPGKGKVEHDRNGEEALCAFPRSSGPSGWRPSFLIFRNGKLYIGDPILGGAESMSAESLAEGGWRRIDPERTGVMDH